MRRIRVMTVFGTRPEAIKMAPVIQELHRRRKQFQLTVCTTAQHRQMLDQVTELYDIPVHYDLNVMMPNQKLCQLSRRILEKLPRVVERVRPDVILVQGDTTTTFVASLVACYVRTSVAHIEAGLRTQDRSAPFPEEINRRLTTHLADYHFAPTQWARENLLREGIASERIFVTGNTVVDALLQARQWLARKPPVLPELNGLDWNQRKVILVTAHRRENFGHNLESICAALRDLAHARDDIEIVFPVHLNPRVYRLVWRELGKFPRIHLTRPLEYLPFVWLMNKAYLALTDSGGIQEEMPCFRRPVLVMREKTERPEGIEAGFCQLVGTDAKSIQSAVEKLLDNADAYRHIRRKNPFGDGRAAVRIVNHLSRLLSNGRGE